MNIFVNKDNFFSKLISPGWVEKMPKFCTKNWSLKGSLWWILYDYWLQKHWEIFGAKLQCFCHIPKILYEQEVIVTMDIENLWKWLGMILVQHLKLIWSLNLFVPLKLNEGNWTMSYENQHQNVLTHRERRQESRKVQIAYERQLM